MAGNTGKRQQISPLQISRRDARNQPLMICYQCREAIEHASLALVLYDLAKAEAGQSNAILLHKNRCERLFAAKFGEMPFMEMTDFLKGLLQTTGCFPYYQPADDYEQPDDEDQDDDPDD